ncbi:glycosyltransferase family 4 protein [Methanonatronarchaeum sp. AMET-Sl]|uniref:glycosyltransferase family 4 protein n=1 Tax=Methanonatronarchaeum sp. AMET-Sl TaxID=3037654 RepID=UPI00244DFBDB|nr:glycosyltransferase family 4 protein [Methanonatronarchaeum sp. AMET-Sl]WGI17651.1 glycosyltransferase family 4 protein [Methanonatronarchaeum sp. AMET-Sl]
MTEFDSIGIVRFPASSAGSKPLSNLVSICSSFSDEVYVVSGNQGFEQTPDSNKINTHRVNHKSGNNIFTRTLRYLFSQIRMSYGILKEKKVDNYLFFWSGYLLLPLIVAKLMGKNTVIALMAKPTSYNKDSGRHNILIKFSFWLSDGIILYSENLLKEWGLEKYKNKTEFAYEHIVDFSTFNLDKSYSEREYDIGYIGRFEEVKNVIGFLKSIPLLLNSTESVKNVFLGGDGSQKKEAMKYIENEKLEEYIHYEGWIEHNHLPGYLNELKVLALPSHSEGLPNIMLEAMACGTPVLASPVGSIPDIIEDGENGFILKENTPEGIAEKIKEIDELEESKKEEIARKAYKTVKKHHTSKKVKENYKQTLKHTFK